MGSVAESMPPNMKDVVQSQWYGSTNRAVNPISSVFHSTAGTARINT